MPANLRPHMLRLTLACALAACLAACAGDKDKDELPPDEVVESLYNKAADTLDKGEYTEAAKQFAEVERQHPYSQWATKAQVMEAFSYYQNTDYDEAVTAL
ncbi:MAG: outer membrane protein assembly factor BamD, partial [Alphaproteobacteria bacterium]|nr:outer membrane protein assembly factor BamD [Alphaproteobacteria bacterium]